MLKYRPHRRGFTLIEILMSLVIILILVSMSAGTLLTNLKKAAVQRAVADIALASDTARQLALYENSAGNRYYGVHLVDRGPNECYVEVVSGQGGAAPTVWLANSVPPQPIYRATIPSSVVVWAADSDLRSTSDQMIAWYFSSGVGEVHGRDAASPDGLTAYVCSVGMESRTYGNVYGTDVSQGQPDLASPVTDANDTVWPGISVRSGDGYYRSRFGVYPNGVAFTVDFSKDLTQ